MKIRNLLLLAITMALTPLCASAQERDGSVTYTDHSKQSITISRFGTVLSFRNSNGKETAPGNAYRVCLCGQNGPCTESATTPSKETSSKFEVEFPKQGARLQKGETLIVTATFRQEELAVKRRLTWEAGSSSVNIDEIISASKALCVTTFAMKAMSLAMKMCPRPPGAPLICPSEEWQLNPTAGQQIAFKAVFDFSTLQ